MSQSCVVIPKILVFAIDIYQNLWYNVITVKNERGETMSKPKKKESGGKKLSKYEKVLLTTATLNLIKALVDLIRDLLK